METVSRSDGTTLPSNNAVVSVGGPNNPVCVVRTKLFMILGSYPVLLLKPKTAPCSRLPQV